MVDQERRGSVNCLKHSILVAQVGRGSGSKTSLMLCSNVRYDITIQVRQNHNLNALVKFRIQHLCAHCVNQTLLDLDFRIFLTDLADSLDKVTVSQLHNICLGYDSHILFAVLSCELESRSCNALASLLGLYLEVDRQVIIYLNSLVAPDVLTLDVLTEESPVNVLVRNLDRADCCEQFKSTAQQAVCGYQVRPRLAGTRGNHRPLDEDIAFLDLFKYLVRKALQLCGTILNGHALNLTDLDASSCDFRCQQIIQNTQCLFHDDRANAVAWKHADDDLLQLVKIGYFVVCLHALDALKLGLDQLAELFLCSLYILYILLHDFPSMLISFFVMALS